jgi:hypothetical protein
MVASFAGIMTSTAFDLGLKKGGGERPRCDDLVAPLMQDRSAATLFHGERLLRPANVSLACASHRWRAVSHSALRAPIGLPFHTLLWVLLDGAPTCNCERLFVVCSVPLRIGLLGTPNMLYVQGMHQPSSAVRLLRS